MGADGERIAALGATGHTGRLITHALHRRRAPLLLAARRADGVPAPAFEPQAFLAGLRPERFTDEGRPG